MSVSEVQDDNTFLDEIEDRHEEGPDYLHLSSKRRERLIKRLANCGLPTREIVRLSGISSRTVARTLQRLGTKRKRYEVPPYPFPRKRQAKRMEGILTQYYAIDEHHLNSLHHLARGNGISLKKLFDLIRKHVSPSRWAVRTCLVCGQPALTPSPKDRTCPACRKEQKEARGGINE